MRIVDVSAFYSPAGGGVRTYVEAKLKAAARLGHEIIVLVPGKRDEIEHRGPGAILARIASPTLPVDSRYRYFDDQRALHRALDCCRPDHVEASSPWSSATMVGRWQGPATRSLVMHADPLAAYAYRWLGGLIPIPTIDRWFGAFWRHMRGLGRMFDTVICANGQLAARLEAAGVENVETIKMGVEPGRFSPRLRSSELRNAALASLGLDQGATLLLAMGRFSAEKRWEMVIRAVETCARRRPLGLLLIGDGPRRAKLEVMACRAGAVAVPPRLDDRHEVARLMASADALVHGCEAETFCLVAAEARASGTPLIIPDRGAALDLLAPHAGTTYRAGNERSLERAIARFVESGVELQRAAGVRASSLRSMDQHFADLFAHYGAVGIPTLRPASGGLAADAALVPELALARSVVTRS